MGDAPHEPLQRELERLLAENKTLRMENDLLRQKLDQVARRLFGRKSEELSPDQLQLLFQELLAPGPAQGKESGRRQLRRRRRSPRKRLCVPAESGRRACPRICR